MCVCGEREKRRKMRKVWNDIRLNEKVTRLAKYLNLIFQTVFFFHIYIYIYIYICVCVCVYVCVCVCVCVRVCGGEGL